MVQRFLSGVVTAIVAVIAIVAILLWVFGRPAPTPQTVAQETATVAPVRDPLVEALATQVAKLSTTVPTSVPITKPTVVPPISVPKPAASGNIGLLYESEGGVPYNGNSISFDVAPDEIEVLTGGPMEIGGTKLPGGETRGSVIVLLPDPNRVSNYTINGVIAGSNWHGAYRPIEKPLEEAVWRQIANDRAKAMMEAPNCTSGKGCAIVDVLVIKPGPALVERWEAKPSVARNIMLPPNHKEVEFRLAGPLASGQTWTVPDGGWTCSGDIKVYEPKKSLWLELYDSGDQSSQTGLVVYFTAGAQIHAPWGAYCSELPEDGPNQMRERLEANGLTVMIVSWPAWPVN